MSHQNFRLSEVVVPDNLGSDHFPVVFSILGPVRAKETFDPVENFTDWERFQSFASELISTNIQIHCSEQADKAARNFAASIALACRKITLLDQKYELLGLYHLLELKRSLEIVARNQGFKMKNGCDLGN
jgi:hypothetical protein